MQTDNIGVTTSPACSFEIIRLKLIDFGQARLATAVSTEKVFAGNYCQRPLHVDSHLGNDDVVNTAAHQTPKSGQWPYESLVSKPNIAV